MGLGSDPLLLEALRRMGPRMLADVVWSVVRGQPRSLAADAGRMSGMLRPAPKVEGVRNVPGSGPFLLVANHFQPQRLWVGWVAAAITTVVASAREGSARELHWMVTAEWRTTLLGKSVANPLASIAFPRAARTWGMVAIPADPGEVHGRARALRQAFGYLGRREGARLLSGEPIAILPEGTGTTALQEAKPGSGAFIHRVSSMGAPVVPVGVHEEVGTLVIRIGEPFFLPPAPPGAALDDWARQEVMSAVGRLLPRPLWGAYAEAIRMREESRE